MKFTPLCFCISRRTQLSIRSSLNRLGDNISHPDSMLLNYKIFQSYESHIKLSMIQLIPLSRQGSTIHFNERTFSHRTPCAILSRNRSIKWVELFVTQIVNAPVGILPHKFPSTRKWCHKNALPKATSSIVSAQTSITIKHISVKTPR